jgi:Protein kinase domain
MKRSWPSSSRLVSTAKWNAITTRPFASSGGQGRWSLHEHFDSQRRRGAALASVTIGVAVAGAAAEAIRRDAKEETCRTKSASSAASRISVYNTYETLVRTVFTQTRTSCESPRSQKTLPMRKAVIGRRSTVRKMEQDKAQYRLQDRYTIDWASPLGEGSFGAVFLGIDKRTGHKVAVKQISKQYTNSTTLQDELRALLHLRDSGGHPNICSLLENFSEEGFYYLTLDLIEGGEMFDHLVEQGAFSEAEAARLVREVASALAFLHGIGVTHCGTSVTLSNGSLFSTWH